MESNPAEKGKYAPQLLGLFSVPDAYEFLAARLEEDTKDAPSLFRGLFGQEKVLTPPPSPMDPTLESHPRGDATASEDVFRDLRAPAGSLADDDDEVDDGEVVGIMGPSRLLVAGLHEPAPKRGSGSLGKDAAHDSLTPARPRRSGSMGAEASEGPKQRRSGSLDGPMDAPKRRSGSGGYA